MSKSILIWISVASLFISGCVAPRHKVINLPFEYQLENNHLVAGKLSFIDFNHVYDKAFLDMIRRQDGHHYVLSLGSYQFGSAFKAFKVFVPGGGENAVFPFVVELPLGTYDVARITLDKLSVSKPGISFSVLGDQMINYIGNIQLERIGIQNVLMPAVKTKVSVIPNEIEMKQYIQENYPHLVRADQVPPKGRVE